MNLKELKEKILDKLRPEDIYGEIQHQTVTTNGWVSGRCPMHNDKTNSFAFCSDPTNPDYLRWRCFAEGNGGSFADFLMIQNGDDYKTTLTKLAEKLGIQDIPKKTKSVLPHIKKEVVEQYHSNLISNEKIKEWVSSHRGINLNTIRKYLIGWDDKRQRNTFPVFDKDGSIVNIRLYSAKSDAKLINYTVETEELDDNGKRKEYRYGSPVRLYGLDELYSTDKKQVIFCEGEWDRLLLSQNGFVAVTGTAGVTSFNKKWVEHFKDRDVVIICDCDQVGRKAVENNILPAFKNSEIASIKVINLPLTGSKDDKDITDYFHKKGLAPESLQELIDNTPAYSFDKVEEKEEIIELDSFVRIEEKQFIDKKVKCKIVICGETSETFHAVEEFKVEYCQAWNKGSCSKCSGIMKLPAGTQEYIGSCMSTNAQVTGMLRDFCCDRGAKPTIEIVKKTVIKEFFCHQLVNRLVQLKIEDTEKEKEKDKDSDNEVATYVDGKEQELLEKRVYYMSSEKVSPGNYEATGWVKTHPKTQQITFLIEYLLPLEDDFQRFNLEENIEKLRILKNMTMEEKLTDIRENVVRVFKRDDILIAILITYCSPLHILFNGEYIRGWISVAIIGDSGVAKTTAVKKLSDYVNIGDMFSGQTGSRTGLAYAMEEHAQKGWIVKVGRFPANTRKLLIVDEVQEIRTQDLKTIAKAMDEGFMQVDRVSSKGYETQTRLIMLGNPKWESIMDEYQFGCLTLKGIFPVIVTRRIDLAVFANVNDIENTEDIIRRGKSETEQKVTSEVLKSLIFWAWTIKPENITITDEAKEHCFDRSFELSEKFGYAIDIPLINRYEASKTLIRISTAFAILDVSTDADFLKLIVGKQHINMAYKFLCTIYTNDNCMLDEYSELKRKQDELCDYGEIETLFLRMMEKEKTSITERNVLARMLNTLWSAGIGEDSKRSAIKKADFCDMIGCSKETVGKKIKILKRYSLIETTKDGYVKLPKFIRFLKRFRKDHPDLLEQNNVEDILKEDMD